MTLYPDGAAFVLTGADGTATAEVYVTPGSEFRKLSGKLTTSNIKYEVSSIAESISGPLNALSCILMMVLTCLL